ncbi:MAG: hypothetical protein ABI317_03940 [Gaiellales bacterium]
MTLHVDSATIRNQSVLAHVLDPVDSQTQSDLSTQNGNTTSTDSAAISSYGQTLAAMGGDNTDELGAVSDAESLVRSISSRLSSSSSATAAALHGSIDRSRASALLVD